ncbi:MAG: lytic transglycosylase domain-containing protein, partial [Thermodesulfobacteriota bacterium]|nr:lytic transglycosylase domain-containing protein [Thermodesulfobacteriota bacterium]
AGSWSKLSKADRRNLERNLKRLKIRLFALSSVFLAEIGDYRGFVKLQYKYSSFLVTGRSEQDKLKARRRFHPLAYPGPVFRAAEEFNLHPALILALIRTESYYNPDIISVANARGLMQILPTTGQKIAARLNRPPPHPEALFDPETNIYFGCWYLAGLIREFDGQLPLAVASYNAGPFNVKRWVSQINGKVSLEEFIETIPFDQTRKYVKKVLGAFYMYRFLFCGKAPGLDLTSPVSKVFLNRIDF